MQQDWKDVGRYGTLGLEFALSVLFGMFLGRWLDGKFGTGQWLTLIGLAFGLAAGIRAVLRALRQANLAAAKEEERLRRARKEFHENDPR